MHSVRPARAVVVLTAAAVVAGGALAGAGTAYAQGPATGETVTGVLVQAWPEYEHPAEAAARGDEGPLSWIETEDGESIRVPTDDLAEAADVPVGATVEVTLGRTVADEAADRDELDPARAVLAATVVDATPEQSPVAPADPAVTDEITIVPVAPRGTRSDGTDPAAIAAAVAGAGGGDVADFWAQESDGVIRIGVSATFPWRTARHDCSDPTGLWDEVADAVDWQGGPGRHLMLYLPRNAAGCAYGLGEVGWGLRAGGRFYVQDTETSVIAHELGHNFGLGHSSELQCDGVVEEASCPAGRYTTAYNDLYDVMGFSWGPIGSLNVAQADRLGLLPAGEKVAANTWAPTAAYTLAPVSAATGTRALQLTDPYGTRYWLEYRAASGQDGWLGDWHVNRPGLQVGVTLRRSNLAPYAADSSLLLDGSPSRAIAWPYDTQSVFLPGRSVAVGQGDFTVTVLSVTAGSAVVQISPGATPAGVKYAATGGPGGPLGSPTRHLTCGLRSGGCYRTFAHGSIYWSPATPAVTVTGPVRDRWGTLGWERGTMGYPLADAVCGLPDGGCAQEFQGGTLVGSPTRPVRFIRGSIRAVWLTAGGAGGTLGFPLTDERCGLVDRGCYQLFQNGSAYWSPATGPRIVSGAVRDRWGAMGWERGALRYPVADPVCGLPDGGCAQDFQGGTLVGSTSTAVRSVRGAIRAKWLAAGGAAGDLGYPVADERCGLADRGCYQPFQNGSVYWTSTTGARIVSGDIRDRWGAMGWERGALRYPVADPVCGLPDGGCAQNFQGGTLAGSTNAPVHSVRGSIRSRWTASGGAAGVLGYPIQDEECGQRNGGCAQFFEHGAVVWSPTTGAHAMTGAILTEWQAAGMEWSSYGYPLEEPRTVGADTVQRFEGGTLTYLAAEARVAVG